MEFSQNLPGAFLERIRSQFDSQMLERIMAGMQSRRVTGFRINRLLSGENDPMDELRAEGIPVEDCPFIPDAAWVFPERRQKLLLSSAYQEKRIYVQNLASMLPVLEMDLAPGNRILDLTAAPGSKTLQIAETVGEASEIAAVEVSRERFFRLKANLRDFGAEFVKTFLRDGSTVWRVRPEYFDRVLLDAPCASEGRFLADDPESYRYWTPRKTAEMVRKQKRLLFSAIQSTKPGGLIVYSTCSLSAEENEHVVSKLLTRFGDELSTEPLRLSTEPLRLALDEMVPPMTSWRGKSFHAGLGEARRILPSERMEGFFICKIRKHGSTIR